MITINIPNLNHSDILFLVREAIKIKAKLPRENPPLRDWQTIDKVDMLVKSILVETQFIRILSYIST